MATRHSPVICMLALLLSIGLVGCGSSSKSVPAPPPPAVEPTEPPVEEPDTSPVEEPDTPPVEEPSTPPVEEPDTPPVEEPDTPPVEEPDTPAVEEPDTSPVEEPDTPPVEEPSTPPVEEPDTPPVEEPDTPPVEEPDTPPVEESDTSPVEEPGTPVVVKPNPPAVVAPNPPAVVAPNPPAIVDPWFAKSWVPAGVNRFAIHATSDVLDPPDSHPTYPSDIKLDLSAERHAHGTLKGWTFYHTLDPFGIPEEDKTPEWRHRGQWHQFSYNEDGDRAYLTYGTWLSDDDYPFAFYSFEKLPSTTVLQNVEGTATYIGFSNGLVRDARVSSNIYRTESDFTMTVDFDNNVVSGVLDNFRIVGKDPSEIMPWVLTLEPTSINISERKLSTGDVTPSGVTGGPYTGLYDGHIVTIPGAYIIPGPAADSTKMGVMGRYLVERINGADFSFGGTFGAMSEHIFGPRGPQ